MKDKKKVIIIAVAIVVLICGIVSVIGVHNKANTEEQTTTTTTEQTTEKQATTEKATTTTEKETETTTEATNTTTKKETNTTTTTKKPSSSSNKTITTTKKEETTKKPATTQSNKNEDLSKLGVKAYGDMARAGLYYDDNGNRTTYDKIAEGEWYYYYDSYGDRLYKQKPYSKENEPPTVDISKCLTCGKNAAEVNGEFACAHGGCTSWIKDVTCYYCGEDVPAHTCHTCKK